jgi:hypothetical protein
VFSQSQVKQAFGKFVTVQLHVGKVPVGVRQVPDGDGAQGLRDEKFQNFALPYYVIVRVKGKTLERIAVYDKGLIDDPEAFVRFLDAAAKMG